MRIRRPLISFHRGVAKRSRHYSYKIKIVGSIPTTSTFPLTIAYLVAYHICMDGDNKAIELHKISNSNIQNLSSYEDYLSYYITLDETSTAVAWLKADMLLDMHKKLGFSTLITFAKDIGQPCSTVANYIRVARAFPPERRN